jgi:uncharacterized membrane protein
MTDRTQETHAAPIDLPLALFGIGLGVDVLGRIVGSAKLQQMARYVMPAAAAAAAFAAAGGFGDTRPALERGPAARSRRPGISTVSMAGAAAALAAWRWRRGRPSVPYLALGLAAIGAVARSGNGARRFEHASSSEGRESVVGQREMATAQGATALRTEAADRLRGL